MCLHYNFCANGFTALFVFVLNVEHSYLGVIFCVPYSKILYWLMCDICLCRIEFLVRLVHFYIVGHYHSSDAVISIAYDE